MSSWSQVRIFDACLEMDSRAVVRSEIENVRRELGFLTTLIAQRTDELDGTEIRASPLSLSTLYGGIERIMLEALRDHSGVRPHGLNWHARLLEHARSAALVSEATLDELKSFLAFRHFIRHAYSFEIDSKMIEQILDRAPALVHEFIRQIEVGYLGSGHE